MKKDDDELEGMEQEQPAELNDQDDTNTAENEAISTDEGN